MGKKERKNEEKKVERKEAKKQEKTLKKAEKKEKKEEKKEKKQSLKKTEKDSVKKDAKHQVAGTPVFAESKEKHFTNRELSWLDFNERVLNEAGNPRVPLAERLTFVSIYQSNLDEFFQVRVGTLMVQMHSDEVIRDNKTDLTSAEQVQAIVKRVTRLEEKKARIYEQLMGELEPHGIRIINFNKLSVDEGKILEAYFDNQIAPFLAPFILDKKQPFPFLNNKELYALVVLEGKNGKKNSRNRIAIIPCTNSVFKRLIEIPTRPGCFMLSEEIILHFVGKLFPQYEVAEKSVLRVTRNADIDAAEVYDEDMDYRDVMEKLIRKRRRLSPVRVELTRQINPLVKKNLALLCGIGEDHIIQVKTPLDLKFVFSLQNYLREKTELFYPKRVPQNPEDLDLSLPLIPQIEKKDVLLSYPFENFRSFLKLLSEAAVDPSVVSIKMTLYRVADRSKVIEALVEAAEHGKEVDVLVELRARFDEANNIEMSRRLEEAGCRIIYGLGEYKVHSKLCIITRKTEAGYSYITQIGTGNYNENTSRLYTDLSLITCNVNIGKEANDTFNALLRGETVNSTNYLFVAPNCLQNKVLEYIDCEIGKAKIGMPAYIGIKINSLTDKDIMLKLYEASQAGVRIELIVRGICCLLPGIPGLSENITVVSIVGRYLEHSRIYRFGVDSDDKIFIASADFMTRNTLRRVEVAVPIYDERLKERIRHIFDTCMKDDEKGKLLTKDGVYVDRNLSDVKVDAQETLYEEAYEKAPKN